MTPDELKSIRERAGLGEGPPRMSADAAFQDRAKLLVFLDALQRVHDIVLKTVERVVGERDKARAISDAALVRAGERDFEIASLRIRLEVAEKQLADYRRIGRAEIERLRKKAGEPEPTELDAKVLTMLNHEIKRP